MIQKTPRFQANQGRVFLSRQRCSLVTNKRANHNAAAGNRAAPQTPRKTCTRSRWHRYTAVAAKSLNVEPARTDDPAFGSAPAPRTAPNGNPGQENPKLLAAEPLSFLINFVKQMVRRGNAGLSCAAEGFGVNRFHPVQQFPSAQTAAGARLAGRRRIRAGNT